MTIQDKKYGLADFILIPFKTSPMLTIIRITEKIISALLPSLQVLATASFVDTAVDIFKKGGAADRIYSPLLFLMAIIAYQNISWTLMDLGNKKLIIKLNEQFRTAVVEKRAKLEYRHIENNDTWELINRACADPAGRIYGGFDVFLWMAALIVRVISVLMILVTQVWWAAIIIIAFSVPLFYISLKSGKVEYEAHKEAAKHQRRAGYLQSIITNRENVEERSMFSYTHDIDKKWYEKYEIARKINLRTKARNYVKMKGASIITLLISVLICGVLISPLRTGAITAGMFMGLVTATYDLVQMMSWELSFLTREMANNREYLKDLTEFSKLSEAKDALTLPDDKIQRAEFRSIEFRNVSFKYPGTDKYILKNLSMKLEAKMHYAFVGVNGAGKTTLTKLLTGLYDNYEGEILINGKSIRDYSTAELKGMFSVVYQDFAKYYISLKDNVALGNILKMDYDKVREALKTVELTEAVEKLPNGIDTYLGKIKEKGVDMSGGEWQRLAIARTLVSSAPVYILDEPTASLDPVAESNVYEMFGRVSAGRSTIFITHRLGAAKLADEILVIDEGRVVEKGSHSTLMKKGGLYARMFESQRSWYKLEEEASA
ncbi:ABC transporter ATP-binding protein [Clostridium thermosuccinogenes]|uniref:ABC transporter ATP-binding protein n=1 Tax=Clostridium thermosuccinogenes TaxID=84032 RepID=UPI000CCC2C59|nr:ABC transporter ATP-binding protein [Pseudoclostridium thermosuccinogenes]PNT90932.1 ABC transporter ATP-binding protein [Pseudoclostridium thermosuccinogenes]